MESVGQNPFESKITQRTEYVPIVATLTGAQGQAYKWYMVAG